MGWVSGHDDESVTAALRFTLAPGAYGILEWRNDFLARDLDKRGVFPADNGNPQTVTRRSVVASLYYAW